MKAMSVVYILFVMIAAGCERKTEKKEETAATTVTPVSDESFKPVIELPPPNEKESAVKYSHVIGWPEGETPDVIAGLTVTKFATGLRSPRNIYVAPNGDIFVALANTESKGLSKVKDAISGKDDSQHSGKSLNQIYLLRDADGDGKPEIQTPYLTGLNQPFGMLVLDNYFYVANTDAVWRYPYQEKNTHVTAAGQKITDLPAGGYNNHWTRNLLASKDASKIYISVGSASNVAEHGIDEEISRANILQMNPDGSDKVVYASGLRNPVGMDWAPGTDELWTVVNERDELGDNLVPDYLTHVVHDGFYGWPYAYIGSHPDPRIKAEDQKPELIQRTIVPDLPLDSHSSSMGLVFYDQKKLPQKFQGGAFITQHGSWNRSSFTGYKILFVPFRNGKLAGPAEDFVTGFIADEAKGDVYGRPVAVAITKEGNLLITDDASDTIWMVR
ncbi:MAG TPA: sorbosone dehydrogenase family protein [Ohtaekwangia sp.]|uniref:PQQ-dependent sugar dehydrogenase n=1 Tax=Ohtaekwangia sp. TaxID=2066019 RepID=UPI002F933455